MGFSCLKALKGTSCLRVENFLFGGFSGGWESSLFGDSLTREFLRLFLALLGLSKSYLSQLVKSLVSTNLLHSMTSESWSKSRPPEKLEWGLFYSKITSLAEKLPGFLDSTFCFEDAKS